MGDMLSRNWHNYQLQDFLFNNQFKTLVLVLLSTIELQIRHKLKAL
jgi:hypothetical protein